MSHFNLHLSPHTELHGIGRLLSVQAYLVAS